LTLALNGRNNDISEHIVEPYARFTQRARVSVGNRVRQGPRLRPRTLDARPSQHDHPGDHQGAAAARLRRHQGDRGEFHGLYSPSAGSVYPILQELEDQDFVRSAEARGKRIYSITNDGQQEEKGLNFTEQLHPFRRFATLCRGRSRSGSSVVATEPSRAHSKTPAPSRTRKRRRSGSSAPGCSRSRWCRRAATPHRLGSVLHRRGCSRRLASGPV